MSLDNVFDWSATAVSNSDIGGINIGEGMARADVNDAVREMMTQVVRELANKGSDIASASTTAIAATGTSSFVHITGTTTITSFGTPSGGYPTRWVVFDGALTLTYNATSLILPTAANITTATGDIAVFKHEGSGNWRCLDYQRADGSPLTATTIANNSITYAKIQDVTAASRLLGRGSAAGSGDPEEISIGTGLSLSGTTLSATSTSKIAQSITTKNVAYSSSATTIPADDTIPQITEGTSLSIDTAITPTASTSTIEITVNALIGTASEITGCVALFVDSTANAIAATFPNIRIQNSVTLVHTVSAGSTTARTYRARAGLGSGTVYINGSSSARLGGGVTVTSMTVREILA